MVRTFIHAATVNMAALLRSARLLKFSPSGLLQITGTKRNGPPLGRLYSGVVGGWRTGLCSRQIGRVSENASSRLWPFAVGGVHNYVVATEQLDTTSTEVRDKQVQLFDWALAKLDESVRRTGRITKTLLLRIFHDVCRTGYPSSNQALLLLRSCGFLLPEVPLKERTELVDQVWKKLQSQGVRYDVSHYNALLKVYLQNEFKFSPTDFLARMEEAAVEPNRVTYQRLIAAYCQNGDIDGASTILVFMKNKDLPVNEAVFSSLVTGHARAGDIKSAENILPVMQAAGIIPSPQTYVALLNAYAEEGDMDSMKKTIEVAESAECGLSDRDFLQIIFTLSKTEHQQHIPYMVERLRHDKGFVPDAISLCLSLVTQGQEDVAFQVLKSFPALFTDGSKEITNQGNFFLRHCINMNTPLEKVVRYCKELKEANLHASALNFVLFCALEAKKTDMSLGLMMALKEEGLPLRSHYFWPLLIKPAQEKNTAAVLDLVKNMQTLGVSLDVETLSKYILRTFPDLDAFHEALEDAGYPMYSQEILCVETRSLALTNLANLYTFLSNPSMPPVDLSVFRSSLTEGFRRSSDVDSMAKITELLSKDNRFDKKHSTIESAGYFLYELINSMSEERMRVQEDKLRTLFNLLHAKNITISNNLYKGIRNRLVSFKAPELLKDVAVLVDPKQRVSMATTSPGTGSDRRIVSFEKRLAELKAQNKPMGSLLKNTMYFLTVEENLEQAIKMKQQYAEDMTVSSYVSLINLCIQCNNVEELLNLKNEMALKNFPAGGNTTAYIALVKGLSLNDRMEEAVDVLKEMKRKEMSMTSTHISTVFHMFRAIGAKGSGESLRMLQDSLFKLGLTKPTSNLCSPLISVYLESNDVLGALEEAIRCHKEYNVLPRMHDILVALVEQENTDALQKAMDFVNQQRGEMTMLYDLFFAFLQTGRYREARKIIETPGLRAKPGRMQWYAEKCIYNKKAEPLEQLVSMTDKLFECDRDEMYSYLLRLYSSTNNWQKADALWMKMQEENIIPRDRTLVILADILQKNGREVPFEVPQTFFHDQLLTPETPLTSAESENGDEVGPPTQDSEENINQHVLKLLKKEKINDLCALLKAANERGLEIRPATYDTMIRGLLARGYLEEALTVKDIAQSHLPDFTLSTDGRSLLVVTYSKKDMPKDALETFRSICQLDKTPMEIAAITLLRVLSKHGDVAAIQEVESLTKNPGTALQLSNMLFVNSTAIAHINKGDVESAVEVLEAVYTSPDSTSPSMATVFRKVLDADNDKALDKLSAMAERLANHFACYRPVSDLFIQLLDKNKVEEAKFQLERCSALAEQKHIFMSFLSSKSQTPGQLGKIKNLLSLVPDFAEKNVLYVYLMKCHVMDKDLPAAKALHEQVQKEGLELDELSLKRLAKLYEHAGETAPFTEPPESFRFYAEKLKERTLNAQATAQE